MGEVGLGSLNREPEWAWGWNELLWKVSGALGRPFSPPSKFSIPLPTRLTTRGGTFFHPARVRSVNWACARFPQSERTRLCEPGPMPRGALGWLSPPRPASSFSGGRLGALCFRPEGQPRVWGQRRGGRRSRGAPACGWAEFPEENLPRLLIKELF